LNAAPDDDQAWLDLLAGRSAPDAQAATRHEAAWLRAALLAYRAQAPAGGPAPAEQRIGRLLLRAREAGVLGPASPVAARRPTAGWRVALAGLVSRRSLGPMGLALAALVLSAVLLLPGLRPDAPEADAMRGPARQSVSAPNPLARRDAAMAALRAAGLDAQPFVRLGRPGLDIALPVPLPAAQADALRGQGLLPPGGPTLQVEFVGGEGR